ncbi:hypothetical protein [Nocardioides sp. LHG3406-4]|uniref:hypothetical protein n=1 Tax=Nocardioides sp. LHG3406-4 TaxID=2804575 RepID=UPI003CF4CB17
MPENSTRVRHAVSRSTGATTWTRKDGDEWKTTCLNHEAETAATSRGPAWKNGSTPASFCAKCKALAAKGEKITGPRLDLPVTKVAAKKASAKPAPKPTAKSATAKAAKVAS